MFSISKLGKKNQIFKNCIKKYFLDKYNLSICFLYLLCLLCGLAFKQQEWGGVAIPREHKKGAGFGILNRMGEDISGVGSR